MEVSKDVLESFVEGYARARATFGRANPTEAEKEKARAGLQKAADGAYQTFKELAVHVADDGNNVPVVMAVTESRNLAEEIFAKMMAGMIDKKEPAEIIGDIGVFLHVCATGPLNMLCWEKFQREQIEAAIAAG